MRLEKIDYCLLAILFTSLLFGGGKYVVSLGVGQPEDRVGGAREFSAAVASEVRPLAPEPVVREPAVHPLVTKQEVTSSVMDVERRLQQSLEQRDAYTASELPNVGTGKAYVSNSADSVGAEKIMTRLSARHMKPLAPMHVTTEESQQYSLVYTLQVGVFKTAEDVVSFAQRNSGTSLSCRRKDNGYWGVYFGAYDNYTDAKSHLSDAPLLERVGAYVVKLNNVSFASCDGAVQSV